MQLFEGRALLYQITDAQYTTLSANVEYFEVREHWRQNREYLVFPVASREYHALMQLELVQ